MRRNNVLLKLSYAGPLIVVVWYSTDQALNFCLRVEDAQTLDREYAAESLFERPQLNANPCVESWFEHQIYVVLEVVQRDWFDLSIFY